MSDLFRIRVMPEASDDVTNAFTYIEADSPQNAASVLQELFDAIDSLERLPHRYKVHRSNRNPTRVVRSMPVPPFVIYYRVLEAERIVEVLIVRHGARKQSRRFK